MRIATGYMYDAWTQNIQNATSNMFQLEQQLSDGKKINQPSDDPYGTTASLNMTSIKSTLTQYNSNLQLGTTYLDFTNSAISDTNSLAQQAYSLAVQGATSTIDETGRNGIIQQINAMETRVISLANTQGPNGEFIFGGQKTNAQPFTLAGNILNYNGDSNSINIPAGPSQTLQINVPGGGIFDKFYSQLEQFKSDLLGGDPGVISTTDIKNFQDMTGQLSQLEGTIGARIQNAQDWTNQNTQRITDLTAQISSYTDINYAQVATQYSSAQTAYQAALQVTASAQKMSLLNYI